MKKVLKRLRAMKKASGLTNKEIEKLTGISASTLNKIFTGDTKDPPISKVSAIVHCLGYTLDDLSENSPKTNLSEKGQQKLVRLSEVLLEDPDYLKENNSNRNVQILKNA